LPFFFLVAVASQAANVPDVNEKILKAFKRTFTYAEDVVLAGKRQCLQVISGRAK